ncbi:hypothetical protein Kpol_309p7 [Vanderwaltozyma polyspora DSM 70294]|uniref:U3 small nucleolar RNA-associated protein 14 n=1 Tax=Vanderwaltozyma polyspora (strain ATCC 22028 / DSM 70294 / BCRC 21397 / CBS 2163 / NBRC 10782 / NRRL Y-8283 / UCD 57-17) TaxID=436907 RepID=A7TSX2_VANPO|nr:uncharacterized protein Kpol_309p7 [Vanderwaltozyma polyspora DSM 70294]EDO14638.1 hypothetical protein Kpol_309p7 [Vanderwaltozyma polyspora DSM 70294]
MAKKKTHSRSKSSKRALNALELAEREVGGYDSDSDEGHHYGKRRSNVVNLLKKAEGGESDEDGDDADSFEDEELDSDEAFGSDDDFDVMNSKFSQTLRDLKKKHGDDYNMDIDEEDGYTSIEDEQLMSLSQVWDLDDKENGVGSASEDEHSKNVMQLDDDDKSSDEASEDSESEDDEEEESGSESDPFDEMSEDENELELNTITKNLENDADKNLLKRLDKYGVREESEFSLPSIKGSSNNKINLADMMGAIDDKEAVATATLVKDEKKSTLAVPLPQRIQKRFERKAAYEISKDEVNRWNDAVEQNKRSEFLHFPLNPQTEHNHASTFTRSSDKPQTELQEKVDKVLSESNLLDPLKESTFEELATAKMTPEEMRRKTAEMRLMRELMFREERKSKRLKKIKSKAYRRIKKKEMLKNKELAGISDESDEERDIARARERMTLKHKANSKWAKDMVKNGMSNDAETREEMEEMLKQGEKLREKILDINSEDEDKRNRLSDLEDDDSDDDAAVKDKVGKTGVMNMAFMKNAEARLKEDNKKEIARLRELENTDDITLFDSDREDENVASENVTINRGRRIYTPGNLEAKEELNKLKEQVIEEQVIDESRTLEKRLQAKNKKNQKEAEDIGEPTKEKLQKSDNDASNPWLDDDSDEEDYSRKQSSKVSVVDATSSKQTKHLQKLEKDAAKHEQKSRKGNTKNKKEDLLLDLDSSNKLELVDPYREDGEDGTDGLMFKQHDVIAEAFAGDNVVAEFEEEKKRVAIDEDDKEEDVTLPGWGDWAGAGSNPKKKRKFVKKIKGVVEKDKRKDKNLQNVIINEKVNKKNLKYQSSAVPFPFESREQYERSLRMPIGQEWTSRASHQKLIKPRINVKPGQIIDPLKAPFK